MKALIFILLVVTTTNISAAVRYNQYTGLWEGNICMNNVAWQFVNWQPLGTLCWLQLPGRPPMQGIVINA